MAGIYQKKVFQAALLLGMIVCLGAAADKADRTGRIQIQQEELYVPGIQQDYHFFLVADTHISLCDSRDAALMEKARSRKEAFEQESGKIATRTFQNIVTASIKNNADLTIFAGDITDSAMYASVDFVQSQLSRLENPYLYVAGNHDFEYGEEYFSKKAYQHYFPRLWPLTNTKKQYAVKEYNDLAVIGLNDKNNQFGKNAVKAVMPYLKGKKPVILVLHVPLQPQAEDSELERQADSIWGLSGEGRCRVLIGETACKPNKTSKKLLDAIFAKDSPVVAVFAGHIHFYNRSMLNGQAGQIVTGAGYYGDAVSIHVRPMEEGS